ncbi:hypothetical protein E2C01_046657 [Portunus trituberculatus]|uniref:Uncharacterized protein n=1 Tax=Portunus trituberculatus TaxID=210409 RepID=A0A5B7G5E5_PORTR|nr:hypothetical protein [Portunus trituberculatus]
MKHLPELILGHGSVYHPSHARKHLFEIVSSQEEEPLRVTYYLQSDDIGPTCYAVIGRLSAFSYTSSIVEAFTL